MQLVEFSCILTRNWSLAGQLVTLQKQQFPLYNSHFPPISLTLISPVTRRRNRKWLLLLLFSWQ